MRFVVLREEAVAGSDEVNSGWKKDANG
jgi:hypothetical protein